MAKFVRASKYRHVFAAAPRKETVWEGVKLTKNAWDSNFVTVSPSYVGIAWQVGGGGAVGIVDANKPSKLDNTPLVTGHKGAVLDLEFSPFYDNILATASEDCYAKIWAIPEGMNKNLEEEVQTLKGHQRKVGNISWNPVAKNVIATGGTDYDVKIWDVETGDEKLTLKGHGGIIQSLSWNYDGSTLCSFCKDKKLRVFDPRTQTVAGEVESHAGVKGGRSLWLGKHDKIFSVGFAKNSERQYYIFDPKNISVPLVGPVNIDNSAGMIMPFYDEDSEILFLAGKGDGNIRYYEIEANSPPTSMVYFISQYGSTESTSAIAAAPKRACDVNTNEIARLYRVSGTKLEPLSFKVPRKSDMFQEDIFPDCRSDEPSLSSQEWFGGANSTPKKKSLQGGFKKTEHSATFTKKELVEEEVSVEELKKENAELKKRVAYLEAELAKANAT